jgi:multicomponent K+:H+ antiporter subunit D
MNHWLTAPLLIPLVGGILQIFMTYAPLKLRRTLALATTVLLLVSAVALVGLADDGAYRVYAFGNWQPPFGIVLVLDRLAAIMLVMTAVLALFCHLYSIRGTDQEGPYFHALFLFQLFGLNVAFLTGDLFNLFVAFEILLIASYGLLLHGTGRSRTVPGLHYVVLNLIGSAMFLIAVGMIYSVTGTLNMADLAVQVAKVSEEDLPLVKAGGLLLLVVFGLKAAVLPLSFWLPRAYVNATAPVAALFVVMTKVGVYSILRVYPLVFGDQAGELANLGMDWLFPAALLTIAMGAIGTLGSDGLKTLIAWQIIVSVGTLLAVVGIGTATGTAAALFYLLNTTWVAAGLFLVADLVANQRGSAADKLVTAPRMHSRKLLSILFFIGATAAVGLPPLSGFFAKLFILKVLEPGPQMAWLWGTILVSGFAMLVAFSRAGSIVFWRNSDGHFANPGKVTLPLSVSAGGLIGMSVVIVVLAKPISAYTDAAAEQLHDPSRYIGILETRPVGQSVSEVTP